MQLGRGQGALSPSSPHPQLPAPALASPRGPGVPSFPLPSQECAQTAQGSPSDRLRVFALPSDLWCRAPSRNVTKPPEKCERPGLLQIGPAGPGRCALPRPAPAVTSCRRARGSRSGRAQRCVPTPPESRWAGLRLPGRGLRGRIPGRGRAEGSLRPCSACGGRAPSRAGHAAKVAGARQGCQARPGPCPPPLGGATSGMFVLS